MGRRGPKPLPDEIKILKGDPQAQRASLQRAAAGFEGQPVGHGGEPLAIPDFLTSDLEREIFRTAIEDYLQRRVARTQDVWAYARWASLLARWITSKQALDRGATWMKLQTKYGEVLKRDPLWRDMLDLERLLGSLEDKLGLNPVARQTIVRGLSHSAMAQLPSPIAREPATNPPEPPDDNELNEPLGFLSRVVKSH